MSGQKVTLSSVINYKTSALTSADFVCCTIYSTYRIQLLSFLQLIYNQALVARLYFSPLFTVFSQTCKKQQHNNIQLFPQKEHYPMTSLRTVQLEKVHFPIVFLFTHRYTTDQQAPHPPGQWSKSKLEKYQNCLCTSKMRLKIF